MSMTNCGNFVFAHFDVDCCSDVGPVDSMENGYENGSCSIDRRDCETDSCLVGAENGHGAVVFGAGVIFGNCCCCYCCCCC